MLWLWACVMSGSQEEIIRDPLKVFHNTIILDDAAKKRFFVIGEQ